MVDFTDTASNEFLSNVGYLSPVGFRLLIDRIRYPNVQFSVQTAEIPDVSVETASYPTPQRTIEIPGDKVNYSDFSCQFIVDEQLENYYEIYEWLLGLVTEQDSKSIQKTRDMTLLVLDSHNNVSREVHFADAYPTSLSAVQFDSKTRDIQYLVGDVTFKYSYFDIR